MAEGTYQNLKDLLLNNERAKNFYKGLPDDVQQSISHHGDGIQTMARLREYAKKSDAGK